MKINENQYYIVRADRSGVFFGKIKEASKDEVVMTDVRKIFYWDGAAAVEQLALEGTTKPSSCKFTVVIPEMAIASPIQIIPCTEKATNSLSGVAVWKE